MDNSKYINKLIDELELHESNEIAPIEKQKRCLREYIYKAFEKEKEKEKDRDYSYNASFRIIVYKMGLKDGLRRLRLMQYYVKLYKELRKIECEGFRARELNDINKIKSLREKWKKVKMKINDFEEMAFLKKEVKPYIKGLENG